jgi:hypothetical protein
VAHDVFVSHSSRDKAIADAVCARLEGRGIRCWIAPRDVQPGLPYGEAIIDAIHNCRIMVLLLSSSANNSIHIAKEVERAVSHGATLIPLRIEAVMPGKSLDYFIGSVHWLDALTPPLEHHLDNLAATILKILPEREAPKLAETPVIAPPVVVVPTPVPAPVISSATAPAPVVSGTPAKNKWLIPVIVGAGVLLLAVVVIVATVTSNQSGSGGGSSIVADNSPPRSQPTPGGVRVKPAPENQMRSASDPVVGCWLWFNNATVVITSNGTATAGPFTAQWRAVKPSRRIYNLTWPEAVDSTALSADDRNLTGGNQYGFPMSATRLTGGPGLPGTWRWYNGAVVTIRPEGSFVVGTVRGRWRGSGSSYSLTWPNPVDTVTLSADHTRVDGQNQYGVHVSGTKTGNCGQ